MSNINIACDEVAKFLKPDTEEPVNALKRFLSENGYKWTQVAARLLLNAYELEGEEREFWDRIALQLPRM